MGTKRAAKVEQVPDMGMKVAAPSMPLGLEMAEKRQPDPAYEESRMLINEAKRALKRALVHAATHDLSYDLDRVSKALQGLNY